MINAIYQKYADSWRHPIGKRWHFSVKGAEGSDHKVKVKFTLEQAMKAQRGSRGNSSTLSLTSALDGGGWSKPRPGRFIPANDPVSIVQEAG
jgi:hypothetical protein